MAQAPAQPSGGGGGNNADNAYAPIWIITLLFLSFALIWYFFKEQIITLIFFVKIWQAKMVLWTLNLMPTLSLKLFSLKKIQVLNDATLYMKAVNPALVNLNKLMTAMKIVGSWIRWPLCFILLILAWRLYMSNFITQYKRTYDMRTLLNLEHGVWPKVSPVVSVDLVKQDISQGPWAMSLSPLDIAEKNSLLEKELIQVIEPSGRKGPVELRVKVDKSGARRVFTGQLGPYWQGIKPLNKQTKFMFAVFLARIERNRDTAEKLLTQAAVSYDVKRNTVNLSGADAVIRKYQSNKTVQKLVNQHAFVSTVMISMLEEARRDGVFPSADFLWLKPFDRRLWYILNCVGRQTPFPEVAGIYSHWLAEKELRRRSMVPVVDEAVRGLEIAIADIKFKPDY